MDPHDHGRHVHERIREILDDPSMRGARLAQAIADLGATGFPGPFQSLLSLLTHLEIPEAQAHRTLVQIEDHRAALEQQLGRDPGLCVAALDYLSEIEGSLRNPAFREGLAPALPPEKLDSRPSDAAFLSRALVETRRSERYGRPLAFVLLVPDAQPAAGEVLEAAAAVLRDAVREADEMPAVLEDGLILILPHTAADAALRAADRFRDVLRTVRGDSWSAGLATREGAPLDPACMLRDARQAWRAAHLEGGRRSRVHRVERRSHPRREIRGGLTATVLRGGLESAAALEDLSIGGARLRVSEAVQPGSGLRLTIREEAPRGRVVTLPANVRRLAETPAPGVRLPFLAGIAFAPEGGDRSDIARLLADIGGGPGAPPEVNR